MGFPLPRRRGCYGRRAGRRVRQTLAVLVDDISLAQTWRGAAASPALRRSAEVRDREKDSVHDPRDDTIQDRAGCAEAVSERSNLARISHTPSAAKPDSGLSASLRSLALLNVVSTTHRRARVARLASRAALRLLATNACEKCGLAGSNRCDVLRSVIRHAHERPRCHRRTHLNPDRFLSCELRDRLKIDLCIRRLQR